MKNKLCTNNNREKRDIQKQHKDRAKNQQKAMGFVGAGLYQI
jgi:hypothetical protein